MVESTGSAGAGSLFPIFTWLQRTRGRYTSSRNIIMKSHFWCRSSIVSQLCDQHVISYTLLAVYWFGRKEEECIQFKDRCESAALLPSLRRERRTAVPKTDTSTEKKLRWMERSTVNQQNMHNMKKLPTCDDGEHFSHSMVTQLLHGHGYGLCF